MTLPNSITNLEQEINNLLKGLLDLQGKKVKVKGASKVVKSVSGVIRLSAGPHFGLTIHSGSAAEPYVVALKLADSARYLPQLIALVGKPVCVQELLVVCERFSDSKNRESTMVNSVAKYESITVLENSETSNESSDYFTSSPASSQVKVIEETNDSEYRVMVHNVSMPFHDKSLSTTVCLVYASYLNSTRLVKKLWLVLKSNQVSWKDFIVSNREYIIQLPSGLGANYFDCFQKPLEQIFVPLNKELSNLYHHKDLFHTMNGCELPPDTKLYLTNNTSLSNSINKFCNHVPYGFNPFSSWFRADEADQAKDDFVSVYGRVHSLMYDQDLPHQSCYMCKRAGPREPVISRSRVSAPHSWLNPLESTLTLEHASRLEVPQGEHTQAPENVLGGLVQTIIFRELSALKEVSVYIKHSHLPNTLPLPRIVPGMVVGITNLIRRRSSSGNCYLIATILSDFNILSCDDSESEDWGTFGLHLASADSQDKVWGTLSGFNLMKLAIRAKCNGCRAVFHRNRCSHECPSNTCTVSAHAICWINVLVDKNRVCLEKVLIKDHLVQKLLLMPDDIWAKLQEAACEREIVCMFNDMESDDGNPLSELIKIYCNNGKPAGDFYISVRKLTSSNPDDDPFFFCVNLEPINYQRLNIVADLVRKESKLK